MKYMLCRKPMQEHRRERHCNKLTHEVRLSVLTMPLADRYVKRRICLRRCSLSSISTELKYIVLFFILFVPLALGFPKPVGYVNDFASVLTDTSLLEQELRAYEMNTTIEIAVVTVEALPPDQTAATYAVELFQEWGIGKKGEDNGVLVLIVKNGTTGNRMRIELGYGIQGYVTGAEAGRILDEALPYYTGGDYQAAAETILIGISDELVDYVPAKKGANSSYTDIGFNILFFLLSNFPFFIFLIIIIVSVGMSHRCPYCVTGRITCSGDYCVCQKCGRKFKKKKRFAPVLIGGFHRSGGGFGGFGGGGSGGGGAGR